MFENSAYLAGYLDSKSSLNIVKENESIFYLTLKINISKHLKIENLNIIIDKVKNKHGENVKYELKNIECESYIEFMDKHSIHLSQQIEIAKEMLKLYNKRNKYKEREQLYNKFNSLSNDIILYPERLSDNYVAGFFDGHGSITERKKGSLEIKISKKKAKGILNLIHKHVKIGKISNNGERWLFGKKEFKVFYEQYGNILIVKKEQIDNIFINAYDKNKVRKRLTKENHEEHNQINEEIEFNQKTNQKESINEVEDKDKDKYEREIQNDIQEQNNFNFEILEKDEISYIAGLFDSMINMSTTLHYKMIEIRLAYTYIEDTVKKYFIRYIDDKVENNTTNGMRRGKEFANKNRIEKMLDFMSNNSVLKREEFILANEALKLWNKNDNRCRNYVQLIKEAKNNRSVLINEINDAYIAGIFDGCGFIDCGYIYISLGKYRELINPIIEYLNYGYVTNVKHRETKIANKERITIGNTKQFNNFIERIFPFINNNISNIQNAYKEKNPSLLKQNNFIKEIFEKEHEHEFKKGWIFISYHKGHIFKDRICNSYEIWENEENEKIIKMICVKVKEDESFFYFDFNYLDEIRFKDGKYRFWAQNELGYVYTTFGRNYRVLHHEIMDFYFNEEDGLTIDHLDRNPCNNIKSNLRVATRKEQADNKKPYVEWVFKKDIKPKCITESLPHHTWFTKNNNFLIRGHPLQKCGKVDKTIKTNSNKSILFQFEDLKNIIKYLDEQYEKFKKEIE